MSQRSVKALQCAGLIALLIAVAHACACSTVQTPATKQIDTILSDGSLDIRPTDKPEQISEKKEIRAALMTAKAEIVKAEKQRQKAEAKAQKDAVWAYRGKGAVVLAAMTVALLIIGAGARIFLWVTGNR